MNTPLNKQLRALHDLSILGVILLGFVVVALTGCAATPATTATSSAGIITTTSASSALTNTLTGFCSLAPAEFAAVQASATLLSPTAQADLPIVNQGITTLCAAGVVESTANLQQFAQTVLPAFTVIALEYAASKAK